MINQQPPIYIIGDTPLAYALAAKLTLAEERVFLIAGKKNILFSSPILLREDNILQKNRVSIQTTHIMHQPAKMVIFDAYPNTQKSFLTYFSANKTSDCPILSFCHTSSPEIIDNLSQYQIIPAYFNGHINTVQENNLIIHNSRAEITISTNEKNPHFELIQKILSKTYFKINFNSNNIQNFWKHFVPYASCSLFSRKHGNNIKEITKIPEYRHSLNKIIDEILSIAPFDSQLDKEQIITYIYSTPGNYIFPITNDTQRTSCGELMYIANIINQHPKSSSALLPMSKEIIEQSLKYALSQTTKE